MFNDHGHGMFGGDGIETPRSYIYDAADQHKDCDPAHILADALAKFRQNRVDQAAVARWQAAWRRKLAYESRRKGRWGLGAHWFVLAAKCDAEADELDAKHDALIAQSIIDLEREVLKALETAPDAQFPPLKEWP